MPSNLIPCPNPECENGEITVFNAYSPNPLQPETEHCALCLGEGFIFSGDQLALAN